MSVFQEKGWLAAGSGRRAKKASAWVCAAGADARARRRRGGAGRRRGGRR
uniref:Uncharacterized protein n=1 Tax=Arundo donax TaxID=35708 RepID=A0A0A9AA95_ARUDO